MLDYYIWKLKIKKDENRFARLLKGEQALKEEQQLHYGLLSPASEGMVW